jgi:hypothetical protein
VGRLEGSLGVSAMQNGPSALQADASCLDFTLFDVDQIFAQASLVGAQFR